MNKVKIKDIPENKAFPMKLMLLNKPVLNGLGLSCGSAEHYWLLP